MPRAKRDIYKGRFEEGFDINRDVDLEHLRELMSISDIDAVSYNYYGLYCTNIIKIMLNSVKFRGYPDDVKADLTSEAVLDMLKARTKFDGEKYNAPTAPFNYLYRIGFHSFQHVLTVYYRMQNRMVPASQVGKARLADGEDFDEDILDKAITDWDAIAENLRTDSLPSQSPCQA